MFQYVSFAVICLLINTDPNIDDGDSTTFAEAGPLCSAYGGVLASPEQLQLAFDRGYEVCAYGWLNDQSLR